MTALRIASVLTTLFALGAGGCGESVPKVELTAIAGSEIKDLEPLLPEIRKQTGVSLKLTYSGTLEGIERLERGEAYDLAWFSHAKYLLLNPGTKDKVRAQEKIMLSPVVLGVKASKARALGWGAGHQPTWKDIAAKAQAGELTFAMTNPAASNSGFTALIGVVSALAGNPDALRAEDVDNARLMGFFKGLRLTAGSSGWLAEKFADEQERLDGMVNYESVLLSLNRDGKVKEPFTLIYPQEGIVTADYPLLLLNGARRDAYDRLVAYLKSEAFQREIMQRTLRRPVNTSVALSDAFPRDLIVELSFPGSVDVINGILLAYLNEQRKPAHSYWLLDTSGSMKGERLGELQHALRVLTGDDASITGKFARFQNRERITIFEFAHAVKATRQFEMGRGQAQNEATLQAVRGFSDGLHAEGDTAIYSTLMEAYQAAADALAREGGYYSTIVLLTDGENNRGISFEQFAEYYRALPPEVRRIRVFPVIFGEANPDDMIGIAELTGGRAFKAKGANLAVVFKEIRGYQ
jgi:Ca-activated chloride channel homolog